MIFPQKKADSVTMAPYLAMLALAGATGGAPPGERRGATYVGAALRPQTAIWQVRTQSNTDSVLQQRVELAREARQRNDTQEELKQLLPALDLAIQSRSIEWTESIAGMLERAYRDVDQGEKGLQVMRRASDAVGRVAGPDSIQAAEFESALAMAYVNLERYSEARTALTEAARKIRKAAGPDSVLLKEILDAQALLASMTGDARLSGEAEKEAASIEERRLRKNDFGFPPDPKLVKLLEQAKASSAKKDDAEVDRLIGQLLAAAEKLDLSNPQRSHLWWESGIVYNSPPVRRPELVDKYLMKSLELSEAALGGKPIADVTRLTLPMLHLQQFALAVYSLTGSCGQPGRAFDCVALQEHCIAVYERALGPNHPAVGARLGELSNLLFFNASQERLKKRYAGATGDTAPDPRVEKALAYRLRELSIYEQAFGKDDPWLAEIIDKLAEIYAYSNDQEKVREFRERAETLRAAKLPVRSEEELVQDQARQLRSVLRFDEAEDMLDEEYRALHPGPQVK